MKSLILAFFIAVLWNGPSFSAQYRLCDETALDGGEILFLSRSKGVLCWRLLSASQISISSLAKKGESARFTYVFGDDSLQANDFDPIFNVMIKELNVDGGPAPGKISLYREKIAARCRAKSRKLHLNPEFKRRETDAATYDAYHSDINRNPDRTLAEFHIAFLNSNKECVRTDSPRTRGDFALNADDYVARPSLLARLFGNGSAYAGTTAKGSPRFRRISVEIGNGEFRNKLFYGSFSVPHGSVTEVIVKDLSTYLPQNGGNRRMTKKFKITE